MTEDVILVLGLPIKREIDAGHLLTSLTLFAGFLWWLYTTVRAWRTSARKDAESGCLRLLLWLLRERQGTPVSLAELRAQFSSAELRSKRLAYCKKDFRFKSDDAFETAIYQLDWEGKIDFVGTQSIAFRVDRRPEDVACEPTRPRFIPTPEDAAAAYRVFVEVFNDPSSDTWKLRDTVRTAFNLLPEETTLFLRTQAATGELKLEQKAIDLLGDLLPRA